MKTRVRKLALAAVIGVMVVAAQGAPFKNTFDGYCVGPIKVEAADLGGWTFAATRGVGANGVEEMETALNAPSPLPPPKFTLDFDAVDVYHR